MAGSIVYIIIFLAILTFIAPFFGRYLAAVFEGRRNLLSPVVRPLNASVTGSAASMRRRRCRGSSIHLPFSSSTA